VAALIALATRVLASLGRGALGGAGRRAIIGGGAGALAAEELTGGGFPGFFGIGGGGGRAGLLGGAPPRRRRRKALTDSDIRIALTLASSISKKSAETFILQRVRSS